MGFYFGFILVISFAVITANPRTPRIIEGEPADPGFAPYHAHLLIRISGQSEKTRVGSGVVISTQHILTTAFNTVRFSWWNVGLGNVNRRELQWHESHTAISHPQYDPANFNNNIAVIILSTALEFSPWISAVRLTPISLPMPNQFGQVSGFGYTTSTGEFAKTLTVATQMVTEAETCIEAFSFVESFYDSIFCASAVTGNVGGGDQGSGFVQSIFLENVLTGLASTWRLDGRRDLPDVFVKVFSYKDWIYAVTGVA